MMLPSIQAKIDKANKHNARLNNSKYAKKFKQKLDITSKVEGGFDSLFSSQDEKESFIKRREDAKWGSVSF